ncbi:MAG: hypothetical protein ACTSVC_00600 [Promethearchaeota archaeon]
MLKKKRIIIDLRIKGLSLNDIVDHFRVAKGIEITVYYIKHLIHKKYSARARSLNRFYDSFVSEKLDIVEFDEVYQGREGKVLGGVHKGSLYLIAMDRFYTKGIEDLKEILKPIAERFPDINIVFTDLIHKKAIRTSDRQFRMNIAWVLVPSIHNSIDRSIDRSIDLSILRRFKIEQK